MSKRTLGAKVVLLFGVLAGLWTISAGIDSKDRLFVIIGCVTIVLGVGISMRQKWARISMLIFSAFTMCLNLFWFWLVSDDTFMLIAVGLLLPVTGFCIYSSIFLTRPKVRELFRQRT